MFYHDIATLRMHYAMAHTAHNHTVLIHMLYNFSENHVSLQFHANVNTLHFNKEVFS